MTTTNKKSCFNQRIVVIGLQCRSSNKDLRLLRWARRHLLHANDVVVLVSCWELATDPKYVRVPGRMLCLYIYIYILFIANAKDAYTLRSLPAAAAGGGVCRV